MTEKIDNRKSGTITGPALSSASSTVFVCGRSGISGGVAPCASKGVAIAAAISKEKIFMPKSLVTIDGAAQVANGRSKSKQGLIRKRRPGLRIQDLADRKRPTSNIEHPTSNVAG